MPAPLADQVAEKAREGEDAVVRGLKCDGCAEVIGVYEPMVIVVNGEVRETSRAAEPSVGIEPVERYHRVCYLEHPVATTS